MKDRKNTTEIDFTDQIKQSQADEKAGYPPNCNEGHEEKDGKCVKKEAEATEEKKECDHEECGNCDCDNKESQAEEMVEVEEHDVNCPSCGCSLGRMWMKSGVMSRPVYASKYAELYEKVKAADPQHDPEKMPEIKTTFESKRKIEDDHRAVELRDVDEPIGFKENKLKEN